MREHIAEPIAMEVMVGKVDLSRALLSLFRDQLNTTPQCSGVLSGWRKLSGDWYSAKSL